MLRSIPFGGGKIELSRFRARIARNGLCGRRVGEKRYPLPGKASGVLRPQGSLTGKTDKSALPRGNGALVKTEL